MIKKVKNIKLYDLEKKLIARFSSYQEVADFTGVKVNNIRATVHRKGLISKKYYIKLAGNINGKIENICNTCGVNLCDKNGFFENGILRSKYTCVHCFRNVKYCKYVYEDPELEKIAKFNTNKRSSSIYFFRHIRNPDKPYKPFNKNTKGICKKCGVTLCNKNEIYKNSVLLKVICKHCARKGAKMCQYIYDDPKLEKLSREVNKKLCQKLARKNTKTERKNLDQKYIRYLLIADNKISLNYDQITPELIEIKKKELLIKRELKNQGLWVR